MPACWPELDGRWRRPMRCRLGSIIGFTGLLELMDVSWSKPTAAGLGPPVWVRTWNPRPVSHSVRRLACMGTGSRQEGTARGPSVNPALPESVWYDGGRSTGEGWPYQRLVEFVEWPGRDSPSPLDRATGVRLVDASGWIASGEADLNDVVMTVVFTTCTTARALSPWLLTRQCPHVRLCAKLPT